MEQILRPDQANQATSQAHKHLTTSVFMCTDAYSKT